MARYKVDLAGAMNLYDEKKPITSVEVEADNEKEAHEKAVDYFFSNIQLDSNITNLDTVGNEDMGESVSLIRELNSYLPSNKRFRTESSTDEIVAYTPDYPIRISSAQNIDFNTVLDFGVCIARLMSMK